VVSAGEANDWKPWTGPLAFVIAFIAAGVVGIVVVLAAFGGHPSTHQLNHPGPAVTDISSALGELVFVAAAIVAASWAAQPRPEQFGLRRPRLALWQVVLLVIAVFLAFLAVSYVWLALVSQHTNERYLVKDVGAHSGIAGVLVACALFCVLAPFCEEFLFRGMIFGALRNWRGPWPAAIIAGIIFGLAHVGSAPVVDLVPLAVLGALLCGVRQLTGSIYPCIALHSLNNALALVQNAGWGTGAFFAILAGSYLVIAAAILLGQRTLRLRLV
jgi:membrane protease YdiL (CAAX protease family)